MAKTTKKTVKKATSEDQIQANAAAYGKLFEELRLAIRQIDNVLDMQNVISNLHDEVNVANQILATLIAEEGAPE